MEWLQSLSPVGPSTARKAISAHGEGWGGEESHTFGQIKGTQGRASNGIGANDGLSLPAEMRDISETLGLTRCVLERPLGVGAKTVVRWEGGTVFQSRATDTLLRDIRAFTSAAVFLPERHGVAPPGGIGLATDAG